MSISGQVYVIQYLGEFKSPFEVRKCSTTVKGWAKETGIAFGWFSRQIGEADVLVFRIGCEMCGFFVEKSISPIEIRFYRGGVVDFQSQVRKVQARGWAA